MPMTEQQKTRIAEILTEEMEKVAREHAASIGFNMQTEPQSLFRMMMVVMSSEEMRRKAVENANKRPDYIALKEACR